MAKALIAQATIPIAAAKNQVWKALVTPSAIKQYMFGADVESDWQQGSAITWKGEMKGKTYEDKGTIVRIDPEKSLQYTHFSPLSGKPDLPENYHTVTIDLSGSGDTTKVSLSQDNNPDENAQRESAKNWDVMLKGLKKYVEQSAGA